MYNSGNGYNCVTMIKTRWAGTATSIKAGIKVDEEGTSREWHLTADRAAAGSSPGGLRRLATRYNPVLAGSREGTWRHGARRESTHESTQPDARCTVEAR
jgi:hypothetical protein